MIWDNLELPDKNIYYQDDAVIIYHSDCRDILPFIRGVSAVVTDPPYGLGFMGKEWDTFDKSQFGRAGSEGINDLKVKKNFNILPRYQSSGLYEFMLGWARLIRDCCLPGAPLLSLGGTRTFHRIACAIEDAGWQIRDTIMWVYGSGFPKSLDISKAIDKQAGAKREVIGENPNVPQRHNTGTGNYGWNKEGENYNDNSITKPATSEAKLWEGYGTALKPAYEPIILAMNPIDGTFANNALKHKVAGLNIDECRILSVEKLVRPPIQRTKDEAIFPLGKGRQDEPQGRFPANFIHNGSQEVMELFPNTKSGNLLPGHKQGSGRTSFQHMNDGNIIQRTYGGDSGSAARFFYCAKASRAERDAGLEDMPSQQIQGRDEGQDERNVPYKNRPAPQHNQHPTVKPLALMIYLCKLVKMPEYNLILDPFCGSGTTLLACKKLGIRAIGIDSDEKSCEIAKKRCSRTVMELVN